MARIRAYKEVVEVTHIYRVGVFHARSKEKVVLGRDELVVEVIHTCNGGLERIHTCKVGEGVIHTYKLVVEEIHTYKLVVEVICTHSRLEEDVFWGYKVEGTPRA